MYDWCTSYNAYTIGHVRVKGTQPRFVSDIELYKTNNVSHTHFLKRNIIVITLLHLWQPQKFTPPNNFSTFCWPGIYRTMFLYLKNIFILLQDTRHVQQIHVQQIMPLCVVKYHLRVSLQCPTSQQGLISFKHVRHSFCASLHFLRIYQCNVM